MINLRKQYTDKCLTYRKCPLTLRCHFNSIFILIATTWSLQRALTLTLTSFPPHLLPSPTDTKNSDQSKLWACELVTQLPGASTFPL